MTPAGSTGRSSQAAAARPDHAGRRRRVAERLEQRGVPGFVVSDPRNVHYLTGFRGSYGHLVLTPGTQVLITDGRYEERVARDAPDLAVEVDRDWVAAVAELAREQGIARIGFEAAHLSYRDAGSLIDRLRERTIESVAESGLVESLRRVKDAWEIARLREACRITDETFEKLLGEPWTGRTERELALFLERTMVDAGAEDVAFDAIVASGPSGSVPHHQPSHRTMVSGDLVTMDFGARVEGYHADMTRTIALGEPPSELVTIHELVREAQALGVAAASAGAEASLVDAVCRDRIASDGYGERFLHPTGHGVGLQIHERPGVAPTSSDSLEAGMVITVEPGVYLPGTGGVRIEDTILITPDGPPERLTTSPRELLRL